MKLRIRSRLSFPNIVAGAAIALVLSTGTAYAANEWTGANIVNESLTGSDIQDGSIASVDVKNETLTTNDILNNTITSIDVKANSLSSADLLNNSIAGIDVLDNSITTDDVAPLNGDADILDNTITTFDIATDAIDSDEVLDFGLSNQDVGVLFAQVNADSTISNSSGGVTGAKLGTGTYEVDFGRDISTCAFTSTQGEGGVGGAGGAITGVTDRAGNVEAVFATTRNADSALVDTAFQLIVVC